MAAQGSFKTLTLTATAPATAGFALGSPVSGLGQFDQLTVDATIGGANGGAIDLVILRKVATDDWREWFRFPQVTAGQTKRYSAQMGAGGTICETATCTDSSAPAAFVLTVNTSVGGHPGETVKLCVQSGTGASAAVVQTVKLKCWSQVK